MNRRFGIIILMLVSVHVQMLFPQGEYSNGQISVGQEDLMKEYSLMRASLVYIARSIDSFFIENKIPSRYKKILSLIQTKLLSVQNDVSMQKKTFNSAFLQRGDALVDYDQALILPVQADQSGEHDFQLREALEPPWNTQESTQNNIQDMSLIAQDDMYELQQSDQIAADTAFFYQGEYATYELQKVDLYAELQQIYDTFDQEFNELALLAVQDQPFYSDFAVCLSSIDEIESISTHLDWDADLYSFVVPEPDTQTQIIFMGKDELKDESAKKAVNSMIDVPSTIILEPIESVIQESVALLDQMITPITTMLEYKIAVCSDKFQKQVKFMGDKTETCIPLQKKQTQLVTSHVDQNLKTIKNTHEIAALKVLIDNLQKQISDSLLRLTNKLKNNSEELLEEQLRSHVACAVDIPSSIVMQVDDGVQQKTKTIVQNEKPLPMYHTNKYFLNFKHALERDQLIRKNKLLDPKSSWLRAQVKKELDTMLKKLKMRTDFGEFGMQTILELVDLEMEIIDHLLSGEKGLKAENAVETRDKVLKYSSPSVQWVHGKIIDVASNFAIKEIKLSNNQEVALSQSLSKNERKLFLKCMQQVLSSYYAMIRNMQQRMLPS